jgi:hypothetical protein
LAFFLYFFSELPTPISELLIPRLANRIGNGNCPLCLNDVMATDDVSAIQHPYDDG